jgi:hypothetical protein
MYLDEFGRWVWRFIPWRPGISVLNPGTPPRVSHVEYRKERMKGEERIKEGHSQ